MSLPRFAFQADSLATRRGKDALAHAARAKEIMAFEETCKWVIISRFEVTYSRLHTYEVTQYYTHIYIYY